MLLEQRILDLQKDKGALIDKVRMMWVWNDFEEDKVLRKVISITAEKTYQPHI